MALGGGGGGGGGTVCSNGGWHIIYTAQHHEFSTFTSDRSHSHSNSNSSSIYHPTSVAYVLLITMTERLSFVSHRSLFSPAPKKCPEKTQQHEQIDGAIHAKTWISKRQRGLTERC